jgi:CheY-like chemotaxis protein
VRERDTSSSGPLERDVRVAAFVSAQRWDDALRHLYDARDASPEDLSISAAIRTVRERQLRHGLERLGSLDAMPRRTSASPPAVLSADARYVVDLVGGDASVDELLDRSTLGRHRTVQALIELLERRTIELASVSRGTGSSPSAAPTERTVLVADGNASQVVLTRTMLRLALGGGAKLKTVASASELIAAVHEHRPDLVVVEFTLPGSDGLAAMRAVRKAAGAPLPAIVVVQRIELAYVESRLPERAVVLARPIEKSSLLESLGTLGVAGARGRG